MTSHWFPGEGRDADDEAFLAGLRTGVEVDGLIDATPDHTELHVWETALAQPRHRPTRHKIIDRLRPLNP